MRKEFIIIISLLCVLVCILFITMCGVFVYMDKNNKRITKDGTDKKISKSNQTDPAENNESSNGQRNILKHSSPSRQNAHGSIPPRPKHYNIHTHQFPARKLPPQNNNERDPFMDQLAAALEKRRKHLEHGYGDNSDSSKSKELH
ncbi:hypothetical protein SLOPH_2495 [Spraguea lophii 42_110]|uniref:Uncharacterized protein n=1 Tax=Spraguea lophii (strain 42_110) TaxID=1358809 RepID=S7W5Z2_SPRLO|nr:hypothetical protein SLOPH_2495 [Spraguea lophii 42_110]